MDKKSCISTILLCGSVLAGVPLATERVESGSASPGTVKTSEATRLTSLEGRMTELEETLALILHKLDGLETAPDPATLQEVAEAAGEVGELTSIMHRSDETGAAAGEEPEEGQEPSQELQAMGSDPGDAYPKRADYGGYMEMHLNHDNISPTTLDFHRFVLMYGHQFTDRIRVVGELELEHALVEGGERSGELELEQAYLDFLLTPELSFRAGMMLTPMGIVNERHEPASFNGVERSFVDTVIIPSTWFGQGAGLVGNAGSGFSFKAFAMSSLDGTEFSAEEGFRGGRQKGFLDDARHAAGVGRLEYAGIAGLNLGASFWAGNTGFQLDLPGRAKVFEFDGQYDWKRFGFRGQFAQTSLDDAARLNRLQQLQTGVNPNIAEQMRGFYLEGSSSFLPEDWSHRLVGFYRYENFDTQYRMPEGYLPLKQFDRYAHILGLTYLPYPDIAFKFDYNFMRNESSVVRVPNRWNAGVGWWF